MGPGRTRMTPKETLRRRAEGRVGARFLSRVQLHRQVGGRLVRHGNAGRRAVVREDAALAARSAAGSGPGDSLGDATLGSSPDDQGAEGGVLESVSQRQGKRISEGVWAAQERERG